ncbi:hypothetical protein AC579_5291 [Pseudocercospora musae]|uniref:F-box domain-containing protein n=1 Tax=Pseudocercospora musae TaxID=113226 RepID=A0A139H2M1_9PEZI|nr:hypothetical protein AC579_5291 [Pseudocercospora musae]
MGRRSHLSIQHLPCFQHRPLPYSQWNCFEVLADQTSSDDLSEDEPRHLLHLPGEILNQIYRYVLVSDNDVVIHARSIRERTALLKTCRKCRIEGLGILLAENNFRFLANIQNAKLVGSWFLAIGSRQVRYMKGTLSIQEQCTLFSDADLAWVAAFDKKWSQRVATTAEEIEDWNQGCEKMYKMATVRWKEIQRVWAGVAEQLWLHAFPGGVVALPDVKEQEDARSARIVCGEDLARRLRLLREGDSRAALEIAEFAEYERRVKEKAISIMTLERSRLLELAAELRNEIYRYALVDGKVRVGSGSATGIFYAENTFQARVSLEKFQHLTSWLSIIGRNACAITSYEIVLEHSKAFISEAEEIKRTVISADQEVATRAAQQLPPLAKRIWRQWQEVLSQVAASMRLTGLRAEVISQPLDGMDEKAVRARTIMVDVLKERVQASEADGQRFDDYQEFVRRLTVLRDRNMRYA